MAAATTIRFIMAALCLLCNGGLSVVAEEIATDNGLARGDWGDWDNCPPNTAVFAFEIKYADLGGIDDEAATGIKMYCKADGTTLDGIITSTEGRYGSYRGMKSCGAGSYLKGFRLNVVEEQGNFRDDMGVVNIQVICEDDTIIDAMNNNQKEATMDYGDWGIWANCSPGTRVCGLQTRVEPEQVTGDDAGLVDMKLACCAVN